jgi:transposase
MPKRSRFSSEVREQAVRTVVEHTAEHPSRRAAITSIATKIGCSAQTLSNWVTRYETDAGRRPGVPTNEQARVKVLEREVKELRRGYEILGKASTYFAHAELDRRAT